MNSAPSVPHFHPRSDFGAPLEPCGRVLHGAGQDRQAWLDYCSLLEPHGLRPEMFMAYAGLRGLSEQSLARFQPYWDDRPAEPPLMQLGLSMTSDGQPEKCYADAVARGECDDNIRALGAFFAARGLPVLMRIGYECTGPWNGYRPDSYIDAFRRVASMLREHRFPLATVWCVEGGWTSMAADYYPGDDVVDWCSVDLFSPDHFQATEPFMQDCLLRAKPVLVGECTPRRVGVLDGPASWEKWYAPFFDWIARHPHVKGFSYINWEWSGYPQWRDWGDARLQANDFVAGNWIRNVQACCRP